MVDVAALESIARRASRTTTDDRETRADNLADLKRLPGRARALYQLLDVYRAVEATEGRSVHDATVDEDLERMFSVSEKSELAPELALQIFLEADELRSQPAPRPARPSGVYASRAHPRFLQQWRPAAANDDPDGDGPDRSDSKVVDIHPSVFAATPDVSLDAVLHGANQPARAISAARVHSHHRHPTLVAEAIARARDVLETSPEEAGKLLSYAEGVVEVIVRKDGDDLPRLRAAQQLGAECSELRAS